MKRPCRYRPTPEHLAKLAEAVRSYWADPANIARKRAEALGRPRRADGKFDHGTSTLLRPWPKARKAAR